MIKYVLVCSIFFLITSCASESNEESSDVFLRENSKITCTDGGCYGEYIGPEFRDGVDLAHRFSNLMCDSVGTKLKSLYRQEKYNRVRLDRIEMSTEGMGHGLVKYRLNIPFWHLSQKCLATTAFDHVGGWGHKPELQNRLKELQGELLFDDYLDVSELYRTPEGLQEYWIQWRHKEVQSDCN